jgi:hypothetical protein
MTRSGVSCKVLPDVGNVLKLQWLTLLETTNKGGECYVMDNLRDPDSAVVVRNGYVIYLGRSDPYSARNCYYNGAG